MPDTTRLVTANELERMPEDDYRYELVRGRLIRMSPVAPRHGGVTVALEKIEDYFAAGTSMVVIVDPSRSEAVVHRPSTTSRTLTSHETLDLSGLVDGCLLPLHEIFT